MSPLAKIKHALSTMCVIFTVIISVMYLLGWFVSDSVSLFVPTPSKALLILLFCGILGFVSLILRKDGTSAARYFLHFILCLVSFVVLIIIAGGFSLAGPSSIIATVFYLAVYAVVMAVRGIVGKRSRDKKTDSGEYSPVFK